MLNIGDRGEWVTACIALPEPYKEVNIDVKSVKLWYKDAFVQAEWGIPTKDFLLVMFPRSEVTKMLGKDRGSVRLAIKGTVNGVEFSGTDTIIVIGF